MENVIDKTKDIIQVKNLNIGLAMMVLLQVELNPRGTERTSGDRMKSAILVR